MAPTYKKKQKRQLITAVVCSVLVFALLVATLIVSLVHRSSIASQFKDENFATAIAQAMKLSSRYRLEQEDLDKIEGLVYFCDIGINSSDYSSYAYPVVMLCDKVYTDALIEQSDPEYEAPEGASTPDYSEHYTVVPYVITEPDDLNMFKNLRLLRAFDVTELNSMSSQCQTTQLYSMYGLGTTAVSLDALISATRLSKLTSLKQLSSLTKLEQISLCYTGITNLEGINQFPNLTKLDATYTAMTDLTGLDTATGLRFLGLNSVNVTPAKPTDDVSSDASSETSSETSKDTSDDEEEEEEDKDPTFNETGLSTEDMALIAKLPNLVYLDITNNNISDLSALSALSNVKYLSIAKNPLTSLSGAENMKGLKVLYATDCLLTDVKALNGHAKLETVYLTNNHLTDLSGLSAATEVTYLDASENDLTDASAVAGMSVIETLNLSGNKLTAAPDLSKLKKVTSVNLSDNEITDGSGLEAFNPTDYEIEEPKEDEEAKTPTVVLNLSGNKLAALTLRAVMLTTLDLSDNELGSGDEETPLVFHDLKALASLNISKNADLKAVPSLSDLPKLATLNASESGLAELPALKGLESLTTVNLSKTEITSIEGLKDNEKITTLTLTGCEKLTDISVLSTLKALTTANMTDCTALNDDSIKAAFGTKDDLKFDAKAKLTVTLTGCKNVKDYSVFDEYGNMTLNRDKDSDKDKDKDKD